MRVSDWLPLDGALNDHSFASSRSCYSCTQLSRLEHPVKCLARRHNLSKTECPAISVFAINLIREIFANNCKLSKQNSSSKNSNDSNSMGYKYWQRAQMRANGRHILINHYSFFLMECNQCGGSKWFLRWSFTMKTCFSTKQKAPVNLEYMNGSGFIR